MSYSESMNVKIMSKWYKLNDYECRMRMTYMYNEWCLRGRGGGIMASGLISGKCGRYLYV